MSKNIKLNKDSLESNIENDSLSSDNSESKKDLLMKRGWFI